MLFSVVLEPNRFLYNIYVQIHTFMTNSDTKSKRLGVHGTSNAILTNKSPSPNAEKPKSISSLTQHLVIIFLQHQIRNIF